MKDKHQYTKESIYHSGRSKTFLLKILLVLIVLNFVALIDSKAEDPDRHRKHDTYQQLNGSYIIGAQIFNDNFIYNPGFSADLSSGFFINKSLGAGIGIGYKAFETESFMPIYGEIIGYKDKENTSFINMKLGYSIGWDNPATKVDGYTFKGGVFISAGVGRKIKIGNNYSALLHWSYQHQFASMEYNIYSTQEYKEVLNYDMIVVSIGIIKENK